MLFPFAFFQSKELWLGLEKWQQSRSLLRAPAAPWCHWGMARAAKNQRGILTCCPEQRKTFAWKYRGQTKPVAFASSTRLREQGSDSQKHSEPPERDLQTMTQKAGSKQQHCIPMHMLRQWVPSFCELSRCTRLGQHDSPPMSKEEACDVAGAPQPLQCSRRWGWLHESLLSEGCCYCGTPRHSSGFSICWAVWSFSCQNNITMPFIPWDQWKVCTLHILSPSSGQASWLSPGVQSPAQRWPCSSARYSCCIRCSRGNIKAAVHRHKHYPLPGINISLVSLSNSKVALLASEKDQPWEGEVMLTRWAPGWEHRGWTCRAKAGSQHQNPKTHSL